jgi:hypothetical protein
MRGDKISDSYRVSNVLINSWGNKGIYGQEEDICMARHSEIQVVEGEKKLWEA